MPPSPESRPLDAGRGGPSSGSSGSGGAAAVPGGAQSCLDDAAIAAALQAEEDQAAEQLRHSRRGPEAAARAGGGQSPAPTIAWPAGPDEESGWRQGPPLQPGPPPLGSGHQVDLRSPRQRLLQLIGAAACIVLLTTLVVVGYFLIVARLHKRAVGAESSGPGRPTEEPVYEAQTFENISRAALDATNKYREFKGLAALMWHPGLANIAAGHASEMAAGTAPFGHEGFDERVRQYPFASSRAAENLGQCRGRDDVATCAVNGWILSHTHEQNLVGDFDQCGIGTAYNAADERWFFTQLFAATS